MKRPIRSNGSWFYRQDCGGGAFNASRNQRGVILPLTLMTLFILAGLVAALLALAVAEPQIAANFLSGTQGLSLAEAGAERAIAQFVADPTLVNNAACNPTCPAPAPLFGGAQTLASLGTYTVTYRPIAFATVLIQSTGQTQIGGVQRTVRVVATTQFASNYALLGDQVEVDGNARASGTAGAIHGNREAEVKGSAFVEQTATSASADCEGCTEPLHVGVPTLSGSNKPNVPIPTINPGDLLPKANYVFGDGVTVVNGSTVPEHQILIVATGILVLENTGAFVGWRMHGAGEWQFSGVTTPPNGTFYASKEIKITASPGSATAPWNATFVAGGTREEGKVEIEGHPNIVPALQDLLIVAGKVKVKGNGGDASLRGVIVSTATHHGEPIGEVELEGSVTLTGNVISSGELEAKGNATVIYNVSTRTGLLGPLRILSWTPVLQ